MKRPESGLSLEASLLVFRLCKAFANFVHHSCTVPIGNEDIHRNPKCGCTCFHIRFIRMVLLNKTIAVTKLLNILQHIP